jgi:hypothetical protein
MVLVGGRLRLPGVTVFSGVASSIAAGDSSGTEVGVEMEGDIPPRPHSEHNVHCV